MRQRIYEIIEVAGKGDKLSKIYDVSMMIIIGFSLVPIAAKNDTGIFGIIDIVTTIIFILDYIMRLITADLKLKKGKKSFALYPITPLAILDMISILPSILPLYGAFRILKVIRLMRTFRVFRVFKVVRYSKSIRLIINVFKKQKASLLLVFALAMGYIVISALIIISIEPETFPNFFDALYWATVSLTSVGYGDIYAISVAGKVITMISTLFGMAIIALPMGIITAGLLDELKLMREEKNKKDE